MRFLIHALVACFVSWPAEGITPQASKPSALTVSSAQFLQRQVASQPDVTVETTHENFFQRMGNAFAAVVAGVIMMYLSVPVLWLNEKRNAKYEALIDKGEAECRSIGADDYDDKNTHLLVHVNGNTASTKPVKDSQFNVRYDSGVIRLTSSVEIYQYVEEEKSETKEKETLGGGKTTETRRWKEYHAQWRDSYNSGDQFEKRNYRNSKPDGLEAGSFSQTCDRVEFGKGFLLGRTELDSLCGGVEAKIDKLVCEKNPKLGFVRADGGYYYCGKSNMHTPQIGDARVRFTVLNDGPATVVALQAEGQEKGRGGFLPYRVIQRSICPCWKLSEEQEKDRLYEEARKSIDEINDEDSWGGFMACLCCGCNLIQCCFGRFMLPEILHAFGSSLSKSEAFKQIRNRASAMKWGCRLAGWLLMFFGLYLTFSPFTTFLKIIPLGIGPFLSSVGSGIAFVFSLMVTLIVSGIIVALAYNLYHPVAGMMALLAIAAVTTGIIAFCNVMAAK